MTMTYKVPGDTANDFLVWKNNFRLKSHKAKIRAMITVIHWYQKLIFKQIWVETFAILTNCILFVVRLVDIHQESKSS